MVNKIKAIVDKSLPLVSNLANVSAVLNLMPNINWCGFYLVQGDKLFLGPFQGEVACTVIPCGRGVCGTAFLQKQTIVVDDVNQFDGHIACSSKSKSEIVVPIFRNDQVVAVIDVDAPVFSRFTLQDKAMLEEIAQVLSELF